MSTTSTGSSSGRASAAASSALRLTQKGYRVAMFESGKRYADHEFPKSTWDLRRYFFAPRLGLHGIFRLSLFKDVSVVSGAGVGGGSLGYANTLYRARPRFYEDAQWAGLEDDWEAALAPHYEEAERMLGVETVAHRRPGRRPPARLRRAHRRRRELLQDARRRVLRRARRGGRRPVLRRRGPAPHRLHRLRALHGRLPDRREEHAAQELPVVRRARRRRGRRPSAPSSTSARSARPTAPTATP